MDKQVWYIASPYTHPEPEIRAERVQKVSTFTRHLFLNRPNIYPFAPIPYTVPFDEALSEMDWRQRDLIILAKSDRLVILCLNGWQESKGVQMEIDFAHTHNIPTAHFDYNPAWETPMKEYLAKIITFQVHNLDLNTDTWIATDKEKHGICISDNIDSLTIRCQDQSYIIDKNWVTQIKDPLDPGTHN